MKIALFIEDQLQQIVLTPESEAEKLILKRLTERSGECKIEIKQAQFYIGRDRALHLSAAGYSGAVDSTFLIFPPALAIAQ